MPESYYRDERRVYYDEKTEPPPGRAPPLRRGPSSPLPRDKEIIYQRREERRSHSPGPMPMPMPRERSEYSDDSDGEHYHVRRTPERSRSPPATLFPGDEEQDKRRDATVPSFMQEKRPGHGPLIVKGRQQLSTGKHTTEEGDSRYVGQECQSHHFDLATTSATARFWPRSEAFFSV